MTRNSCVLVVKFFISAEVLSSFFPPTFVGAPVTEECREGCFVGQHVLGTSPAPETGVLSALSACLRRVAAPTSRPVRQQAGSTWPWPGRGGEWQKQHRREDCRPWALPAQMPKSFSGVLCASSALGKPLLSTGKMTRSSTQFFFLFLL